MTDNNLFDLLDSTCCLDLQVKINELLQKETESYKAFILWIIQGSKEAIIQVVGTDILPEEIQILIPTQAIILEAINGAGSFDIHETLLQSLEGTLSCTPSSIIKWPVFEPGKPDVLAYVLCLVDCPSQTVQQKVDLLCRRTRGALISTFKTRLEQKRKQRCQGLLAIAKNLFIHLGDLGDLMQEIIAEARKLTGAQRCSLFLVSEDGSELVAKVFDGLSREHTEEMRLPVTEGIAGHVATTGETLNIKDAYHHPLFYKKLDELTGFITRDGQDRVVGVAQLCNKPSGFTTLDEEASAALAVYCGIALTHSLIYKKMQQSQARSRLANELLMYHMAVSEECVSSVTQCKRSHDFSLMLDWRWTCRDALPDDTPCMALAMFEQLGFLTAFRMNRSTVARFILLVRKGYRDVPYHNWMHAFSVAHFVYCNMKQLKLLEKSWITSLEGVALLASCLCHDLDHRGTTNSFQTQSKNTLACLYSSEGSVMERHHFSQALCILNTDGCNIFENLDGATYRRALDVMRDVILATDLATHLRNLKEQRNVAEQYDPEVSQHRHHLLSLLATAADLSDQIKGWPYTRLIANLIYGEFFSQGDLEKAMGTTPAVMMNRDEADIPTLQIQFITDICLPCYETLSLFFETLKPCVWAVEDSLQRWKLAKKWFDLPENKNRSALELLNDPNLETFVFSEIDHAESSEN